jgi:hypothetical protein
LSTVSDELDIIQTRLHDDEALWSRDELLRWYNDSYGAMLADSGACRRFYIFDVPPRATSSITQEWESQYAGATFRKFTKSLVGGTVQASFEWEVEYAEGATPTNSLNCVTQLWELDYLGDSIDDHYRFFLPKSHEQIKRVAWDDKRIFGTSDKELDPLASKWWQQEGEPLFYLRGLDRDRSFEVYKIESSYSEAYILPDNAFGLARLMSGDRTYTTVSLYYQNDYAYATSGDEMPYGHGLGWRFTRQASDSDRSFCTYQWEEEMLEGETEFTEASTVFTQAWEADFLDDDTVTFALGAARAVSSPDRQYLPMAYDTGEFALLGTIRDFKSSEGSISVLETISNTRDLDTNDSPALIPPRMYKYLRYYVWAMAFAREGEGQRPKLAAHYMARFTEGVKFFRKLGNLVNVDRNYARSQNPTQRLAAPPFPRLPSEYGAIERQ